MESLNRTKILVTGASGFLGGRIVQYFSELDGVELYLGSGKTLDLPPYVKFGKVVPIQWDSQSSLENACENVDAIIHCAGMNAQDSQKDPEKALEFNGKTTGRFLDAAIQNKTSRFIFLSTAHVYGSPLSGFISEETPLSNLHPYAVSNALGEQQVNDRAGKITGINVRLSNAYGAPVSPSVSCWMLLVNDLCKQAVITKRMVLKSSGLQRRDFIPIYDVCRAFHHLLQIPFEDGEYTFNLGGRMSLSVWDMSLLIQERCKEILGYTPELERVPPAPNEHSEEFEYSTDKLLSTGFEYSDVFTSEIDQLLNFCNLHFRN